jgi:hypothetical protein
MLNDDHGVSGFNQTFKLLHQLRYVRRMQARGGLVE